MRFYPNLFVTEKTAPQLEQIVEAIKLNKMTPNIYVVALASNEANLLDIIPSWELLQPAYPKAELEIVGLANGKKDAFTLVEYMIAEAYQKTGSPDVRTYLQEKKEEQT